jgi:glycosyltransferase involved in cell wall biosynthesis
MRGTVFTPMFARKVSIVLPTRNGADTLPAVLDALARQRIEVPVETLAIDSGSTDGTVALLRRHNVKVLDISSDSFDHGLTRNLGLSLATGDLVVLLVQDAVPASDDWLSNLTAPFDADPRLAGTFARQEPSASAGAITRHYHASYLASSPIGRTATLSNSDAYSALAPAARLDRCTFDNVCSCVRRTIWERNPFQSTAIGEDIAWAKNVLLAGYRLAYVPDAVVVHSHERSVRYEFWRTVTLHRELYRLFDLRTVPSMPQLLRAVSSSLALHGRLEWNARSFGLAFAWPVAQYIGGLSAACGWPMRRRKGV